MIHTLFFGLAAAAGLATASAVDAPPVRMEQHRRRGLTMHRRRTGNPIRGINIGGWLVAEPFIKPSLFEMVGPNVIDEYTLGETLGRAGASAYLQAHWATWFTEADFAEIASYGLTHVRIPIGHWSLEESRPEPYAYGAYPYLKQAVGWAKNHGLQVLIDLHGAPGSQNGYDNSGRNGSVTWYYTQDNIQRTLNCLTTLANDFKGQTDTVYGIEALNEPAGYLGDWYVQIIKDFYAQAYPIIANAGFQVILHDAFVLSQFAGYQPADNIAMDHHYYNNFLDATLNDVSADGLAGQVCPLASGDIATVGGTHEVFVGEFTAAYTDCAKYLNGRGKGARWEEDLGRDCAPFLTASPSQDIQDLTRQYWEMQVDAWEKFGIGGYFWTFKTEDSASAFGWGYQHLVQSGILPTDFTERKFPARC